jgi:poly(A) polymerase
MPDKLPSDNPPETAPIILPRSEHGISRANIDEQSLKVLYRLHRNGHRACLVGGSVRDLLLGRTPKDFDVGTDATPQQVKRLFRNCFLVGRRFRLAHIRFAGNNIVEVATFRRMARPEDLPEDPADHFFFVQNLFGSPREDAFRRDFTINALFYDIADFSIIDHVGGLADLEARRLRVIGDPRTRFTEDPVRMLRALEFSARLRFSLDESLREGIYECAPLIAEAAPARIREELLELFRHAVAGDVLQKAQAMGLLTHLLAGYEGDSETFELLDHLDQRTAKGQLIDEPLALATLFLNRFWKLCPPEGELNIGEVIRLAGLTLAPHCGYFRIAHGVRHQAREMLVGCYRLSRGRGHRGERRFLQHPSTPRALELFELWCRTIGHDLQLVKTWQDALKDPGTTAPARDTRPRRRRSRRRRPAQKD